MLVLHWKNLDGCWLDCNRTSGSQVRNASLFEHCSSLVESVVESLYIYPSLDMTTDFTNEQYAGVYKSFYDFASIYYGIYNLLAGSGLNPEGVVHLTVRIEISVNVPADTRVLSLSVIECSNLKVSGSKMSVLF